MISVDERVRRVCDLLINANVPQELSNEVRELCRLAQLQDEAIDVLSEHAGINSKALIKRIMETT